MNYVQVLEQLVEAQLRPPLQRTQGNTKKFLLQRDAEKPLLLYPWPSSSTMPDLGLRYLESSKKRLTDDFPIPSEKFKMSLVWARTMYSKHNYSRAFVPSINMTVTGLI